MRQTLLPLVVSLGLVGCDAPADVPLPVGACPACRGEGTIAATKQTLIGMSPDASGVSSIPIYSTETEASACAACHGTGKAP